MTPFDPRGSVLNQVRDLGIFQMGPAKGVLVYRFYDADARLLYVGVATTPSVRFQNHKNRAPWWPQVAYVKTERYEHKAAAHRAETTAINAEQPAWNVQRKARHSSTESGASHISIGSAS